MKIATKAQAEKCPKLRFRIIEDGESRLREADDPRAFFAKYYLEDFPNAVIELLPSECGVSHPGAQSGVVLIVPKPDDWTPTSSSDLPPECERHIEPNAENAAAFADGFNRAEMKEARGYWAVVMAAPGAARVDAESGNIDIMASEEIGGAA